jgi:hypothetical protein
MTNLNIKIKISESMSSRGAQGILEDSVIRISQNLRTKLGLYLSEKLTFDTPSGKKVELTVGRAFKEDVERDEGICYVTETTFKLINVENTYKHKIEPVKGITLGCDPELFLTDNAGNLLRAHMFLNKWGDVGHDGILAEFRPKPSTNVDELTYTIYGLIKKLRRKINYNTQGYHPENLKLYSASHKQNSTAGFHLHYGLPPAILGRKPDTVALMQQVVKVMDYYVGIPSIILEGTEDSKRRANMFSGYGKPSDFRLDGRTLEYRVPGGAMLKHPVLTRGLLALGATVMEDIISKIKITTNNYLHLYWMQQEERLRETYPMLPSSYIIQQALCAPTVIGARSHLENIYNDIQKMEGFKKRKEALTEFFSAIENNTQFSNDIELNWRRIYEHQLEICKSSDPEAFNSARG